MEDPVINQYARMVTAKDVMDLVQDYNDTRAILIYANDPINSKLADEYKIPRVTKNTPDGDLRRMDVQKDGLYPVYLIN